MLEIYVHDFPGRRLRFELSPPDLWSSQVKGATFAAEALDLFCGDFVSPLSADVSFSYFDAEFGYAVEEPRPERPFWYLRSDDARAEVELVPAWVDAMQKNVAAINGRMLLRWMTQVLEQERAKQASTGDSLVVGCREIKVPATRVRLPWSAAEIKENALKIRVGPHSIEYPIERREQSLFVSGPLKRKSITAPVDLRITSDTGVVTMDVSVYWSLWTDPQQKGWTQIHEAVERLRRVGWVCTYSQVEGVDPQS